MSLEPDGKTRPIDSEGDFELALDVGELGYASDMLELLLAGIDLEIARAINAKQVTCKTRGNEVILTAWLEPVKFGHTDENIARASGIAKSMLEEHLGLDPTTDTSIN